MQSRTCQTRRQSDVLARIAKARGSSAPFASSVLLMSFTYGKRLGGLVAWRLQRSGLPDPWKDLQDQTPLCGCPLGCVASRKSIHFMGAKAVPLRLAISLHAASLDTNLRRLC